MHGCQSARQRRRQRGRHVRYAMPLMRYVSSCTEKRQVVCADLKLSILRVGSPIESSNEFQVIGPATQSAQPPDWLWRCCGIDHRHWRLEMSDVCLHSIIHQVLWSLTDWVSECLDVKNYKWHLNPVWHRMLYSSTHMATLGVKGLRTFFWEY